MDYQSKGYQSKPVMGPAAKFSVVYGGAMAIELRRLADNLGITPQLFVKRLVAEALAEKYGVTVK